MDQGSGQIPRGARRFQVEHHAARIAVRDDAGESGGQALKALGRADRRQELADFEAEAVAVARQRP